MRYPLSKSPRRECPRRRGRCISRTHTSRWRSRHNHDSTDSIRPGAAIQGIVIVHRPGTPYCQYRTFGYVPRQIVAAFPIRFGIGIRRRLYHRDRDSQYDCKHNGAPERRSGRRQTAALFHDGSLPAKLYNISAGQRKTLKGGQESPSLRFG